MSKRRVFRIGECVEVVGNEGHIHAHRPGEMGLIIRIDKTELRTYYQVLVGSVAQWVYVQDITPINVEDIREVYINKYEE